MSELCSNCKKDTVEHARIVICPKCANDWCTTQEGLMKERDDLKVKLEKMAHIVDCAVAGLEAMNWSKSADAIKADKKAVLEGK